MAAAGVIRRALATLAVLVAATGGGGKGASSPAAGTASATSASHTETRPRWLAEIVDARRDVTIALRPATLATDPVYGPIVRRASRLAAAHGPAGTRMGATALETLEGCDEVTLAIRSSQPIDAVIVFAGVPASADPTHLVDGDGQPLWQDPHPVAEGVIELSPREDRVPAVLFVLPGRTWLVAAGASAVDRARGALSAAPPAVYAPALAAPLVVHVRGELLDRLRADAGPGLAPVLGGLDEVELALTAGKEGKLAATFVYGTDEQAHAAEVRAHEILDALARRVEKGGGGGAGGGGGWPEHAAAATLRGAEVVRKERRVDVGVRLPPAFLRRFAQADDASF